MDFIVLQNSSHTHTPSSAHPGDYAGVKHALREAEVYYNIDVNCLDPLGRSALLIAIENENLEIMELLLDHGIHTGDALLYAIRKEVVGAVELLLSHRRPSGEKQVCVDVCICVRVCIEYRGVLSCFHLCFFHV